MIKVVLHAAILLAASLESLQHVKPLAMVKMIAKLAVSIVKLEKVESNSTFRNRCSNVLEHYSV